MNLNIDNVNSENFKRYMNKNKAISSSLYFKLSSEKVFSNIHNESRSVVKFLDEEVDNIFSFDKEQLDGTIQVCFFDIKKVGNAIDFLDPEQVKGSIEYNEDPDGNDDYLAQKLRLTDGKLSITLECSDPTLGFVHLPDDKKQKLINNTNVLYSFDLIAMEVSRLKRLNGLDSDQEFNLYADQNGVQASTSSYTTVIDEEPQDEHEVALLKKDHLNFLDEETYTVFVRHGNVLFDSQDSETKIVISIAKSA